MKHIHCHMFGGLFFAITVSVGFSISSIAEPYIEKSENGSTNWGTGEISAVGIGVPPDRYRNSPARRHIMAARAARVDALRNLVERVEGVRVESQTLVKDMATESDIVRTKISGTIRNASMVGRPHYMEDGSVEVTMVINYHQSIAKTLLENHGAKKQQANSQPIISSPTKIQTPANGVITSGLIIDATGKGLETAIFPQILDEDGHHIYTTSMVTPEKQDNIVAYDTSPRDAAKLPRLGEHPLIIRALRVQDKTNIIISNADAAKIGAAAGMQQALRQARVAFAL